MIGFSSIGGRTVVQINVPRIRNRMSMHMHDYYATTANFEVHQSLVPLPATISQARRPSGHILTGDSNTGVYGLESYNFQHLGLTSCQGFGCLG